MKEFYISKMITKNKLKQQLKAFPAEFTIDELVERLILIEKIEQGLQQAKRGEVLTEEELDDEIQKW